MTLPGRRDSLEVSVLSFARAGRRRKRLGTRLVKTYYLTNTCYNAFLHLGWEHAFLKQTWQAVDSMNTPYDYSSIMHYKMNAFSRSPRRKTIVPLRKGIRARPYRRISKIDALQVNMMYQCDGKAF